MPVFFRFLRRLSEGARAPGGAPHAAGAAAAAAAAVGLFSSVTQIVILREVLAFARGSELTVAAALFSWLAGIGAGAGALATIPRAWDRRALLGRLSVAGALAALLCAFLARTFAAVAGTGPVTPSLGAVCLCAFSALFLPGALAGAAFPAMAACGGGRLSGARLYLLEGAGSAAGGFVFSFLMAGRIDHFLALSLAALPLLVMQPALLDRPLAARPPRAAEALCAALLGLLLPLASGAVDARAHDIRWRALAPGLARLRTVDTRYQRLDLGWQEGQHSLFADGSPDFSFPDPYGAGRTADLVLLEHPAPRRLLLVGGSPADAAASCARMGGVRMDYVQPDPGVMKLLAAARPRETARLFCPACAARLVTADGRIHVRGSPPRAYDVVWVSLPDPHTLLLNRYATVDFHEEAARALAPGGILATGFSLDTSAPQRASLRAAASLLGAVRGVLPETLLAFDGRIALFAAARKGSLTPDPGELARRAAARGLDPARYPPELFADSLDRPRREKVLALLDAAPPAPANRDLFPVSYRLQLQQLVHLGGSGRASGREGIAERLLERAMDLHPAALVAPAAIAAALLALLGLRRGRGARGGAGGARRAGVALAMAVTGACAIVAQVILLLTYQTARGTLYEGVGLVYALFMTGLIAGSAAGSHRAGARPRPLVAELLVLLLLLLVSLASPLLVREAWPAFAFSTLLGGATGYAFCQLYETHRLLGSDRGGDGVVASAGVIDAADHAGSAAGALLCALALLPSCGIAGSLLVAAAWKASSLAALAVIGTSPELKRNSGSV